MQLISGCLVPSSALRKVAVTSSCLPDVDDVADTRATVGRLKEEPKNEKEICIGAQRVLAKRGVALAPRRFVAVTTKCKVIYVQEETRG